jgi:hypothetical protein
MSVPFNSIDHIQLAMPQAGEDDARLFYGDLLDMPEVQKPGGRSDERL